MLHRSWGIRSWVLPVLILASSNVLAQTWQTWDGSPPGTAPEVVVDASSNASTTTFSVTMHGFYIEEVVKNSVTYHRLIVPSPEGSSIPFDLHESARLAGGHEVGKPELPFDGELVGIVTDADVVTFDPVTPDDYFQLTSFNGHPIRVLPLQPALRDCDCCSTPPIFAIQQSFYDTFASFYPEAHVEVGPIENWMSLDVSRVQVNLTQYRPVDTTLRVMKRVSVTLHHAGAVLTGAEAPDTLDATVTPDVDKMFDLVLNFQKIGNAFNRLFPIDYLIIVHEDFTNAMDRIRQAKVAEGITPTIIEVSDAAAPVPPLIKKDAAVIRKTIVDFFKARRGIALPFVLLIGDVDRIPSLSYTELTDANYTCTTDKQYADIGRCGNNRKLRCAQPDIADCGAAKYCSNDPAMNKKVCTGDGDCGAPLPGVASCVANTCTGDRTPDLYIARISADTPNQVNAISRKIHRYERSPLQGNWPKNVLLAAHYEESPDKYMGNQCTNLKEVTASALAPVATFAPGEDTTATALAAACKKASTNNATITATVNGRVGVVGYRGHGQADLWDHWSDSPPVPQLFDSWSKTEVDALRNGCANPVVFAVCCWNGKFDEATGTPVPRSNPVDGIGEQWIQTGNKKGAVAHYGATQATLTDVNHRLNLEIFRNLYTRGMILFGPVIMRAEGRIIARDGNQGKDTAMEYEPMGDPTMKIRTSVVPAPSFEAGIAPWILEPGGSDYDNDGVTECDDCNDDDPATYPGAVESCDGLDNDCDEIVDNGAPGPAEVAPIPGIRFLADKTTFVWPAVPESPAYDVVRGLLSTLRASGFPGAATCVAESAPGTSYAEATTACGAVPRDGCWYLVRAQNGCGTGTYGAAVLDSFGPCP